MGWNGRLEGVEKTGVDANGGGRRGEPLMSDRGRWLRVFEEVREFAVATGREIW